MSDKALREQVTNLQKQLDAQMDAVAKAAQLESQLEREQARALRAEQELKTELDRSHTERDVKTVYVTKETARIPKLKGVPKKDDDIEVAEWIDDVRRHLASSRLSNQEKTDFIVQHLSGSAKWEIKFRTDLEKSTPEDILQIIQTVFGDPESVSTLQEAFWRRNQKQNESTLDYSLELLKLHSKIVKKDKHFGGQSTLKGKFTEGVRENFLRRELRSINVQHPELEFWELRDRAIQWLGEDADASGAHKKSSCVQQTKIEGSTETESQSLTSMLDLLKKQQAQIDDLTKLVAAMKPNEDRTAKGENATPLTSTKQSDRGRDKDGQKVCFRCRKSDHFVANCPYPAQNRAENKPAEAKTSGN